jgi:hypothetical protein
MITWSKKKKEISYRSKWEDDFTVVHKIKNNLDSPHPLQTVEYSVLECKIILQHLQVEEKYVEKS